MKNSAVFGKLLSVLVMLSLLIQGCQTKPDIKCISRSGFYFDTLISIKIYDSDNEALLDECFDLCQKYEQLLSMTIESSDISRINSAGNGSITVSSDTVRLLISAKEYFTLSDGMLDITVAPLSSLWTKARIDNVPPDENEINALLYHVGLNKITVDTIESSVNKSDPKAMIDMGALAKGYIADALKEFLLQKNVHSAIISLGGNIVTVGSKPDGSPFRIGIRKPFGQPDEALISLEISDKSVVTSGIYERFFKYENKLYHHILDPSTGYPVDTDLYSATIISSSSLSADALSTICLLYGFKRAEELINKTPGVEAVFVTNDNRLHYTEGAKTLIRSP